MTKAEKIQELLTRGVSQVFVRSEVEQALRSRKPLRIYYGVDPSGPVIHLGHAVLLHKLKVLQGLGHKIIFLIGDFTGMIGDPTDRNAVRKPLTREQVLENAKTYKKQVARFLDFGGDNPAEVRFNSEWNGKLSFKDVIELSSRFTVQQFLERDMFQKRLADQKPIGLHEFLYPLIQGYDAVMLDADMQIGGTDQTFNMLQGRYLARALKNKTQMVITGELLVGTDGRKMSKSFDNVIAIEDAPNDMYGKVMSIPDSLIEKYFILATTIPLEKIRETLRLPPYEQKRALAQEITGLYHGTAAAGQAAEAFTRQFSNKEIPPDISEKRIKAGTYDLPELLVSTGLVMSKSEARRLVQQRGVKVNDSVSMGQPVILANEVILQVGKRKFLRLIAK